MKPIWLALLAIACRANLPEPAEPLSRTPDAAFRRQAPERLPGTLPARLPVVRTTRLANGLLVVVATRANSPTTTVELVVRGVGAAAKSEGTGMALATAFALIEGPDTAFSVGVDHEAAHMGVHSDDAGLDTAVRELASAVLRPTIDVPVIEATRRYLSSLVRYRANENRIRTVAYRRLYAEPPALLDGRGDAYTKDAILRHYRRFYGPENAALIVASPTPFERVVKLASEHFGNWTAEGRLPPKAPAGLPLLVPSVGPRPIIAIDQTGDMSHALLIVPGPPNGFPGFAEYLLIDMLLGSSLGSRGNVALRLHDAKTYGVWSRLERRRTGSELEIYFAVEQDDAVESLQRMLEEIGRLRSELVSNEELEVAKIAWQARLSARLVTSDGTVAMLRGAFAMDGDPEKLGAIIDSVARVTPADIQSVARRELTPDRMQVVVFTSRERHEAALRHVGSIWWQSLGPAD